MSIRIGDEVTCGSFNGFVMHIRQVNGEKIFDLANRWDKSPVWHHAKENDLVFVKKGFGSYETDSR